MTRKRSVPRLRAASSEAGWGVVGATVMVLLPSAVEAQAVRGRIVDAENDRPVADAVVRLLSPAGEAVRAAAADSTGLYLIAVPEPGVWRLRAEAMAYEPAQSSPFEVRAGSDTVALDLRVLPRPIPLPGVEVSTDQMNRRLRQFLGMSPGQLRIRPIRTSVLEAHASRGGGLTDVMRESNIPNLQILRTRDGPCYQFRGRGCLALYLDGARLSRRSATDLPLEMLATVLVLLPNESIAYPEGAVHLFTRGFMR